MVFDQEGIKDEEETVASRSGGTEAANLATIVISSNPADAEIEIDGAFAGTTRRLKKLEPGEYKIKIMMDGYKSRERKIRVVAGEEIPISVELKKGY